jgi:hypothetical protein
MKTLHLIVICLILTGCANLSVKVDILNPIATEAAAEEGTLRLLYYAAAKDTTQDVTDKVEFLRQKHTEKYAQLSEIYKEMADAEDDPNLKEILVGSAEDLTSATSERGDLYPLYKELEETIISGNEAILEAAKSAPLESGEPIPPKLREKLVGRRNSERDAMKPIKENVKTTEKLIVSQAKKEKKEEVKKEVQAVLAPLKKELKSIIGGPTLVESEYAYSVASAREEMWASNFNYALGKGWFGDSDIVIKMSQQGDFTVKGMQFDPSTVAAVASKVTTQSLLLAAQIAGVPVSAGNTQDGTTNTVGLAGTGDKITTIDQKLAEREAKTKAWEAAIRDLSQAILSEEKSIVNGSEADRTASGKAIKAIYDAYINTLRLGNLN